MDFMEDQLAGGSSCSAIWLLLVTPTPISMQGAEWFLLSGFPHFSNVLQYPGEEMTSHGFRATFSTKANESDLWHPDAIARALAYARRAFWDERVKMSEWWAEFWTNYEQDRSRGRCLHVYKCRSGLFIKQCALSRTFKSNHWR